MCYIYHIYVLDIMYALAKYVLHALNKCVLHTFDESVVSV